ncbi:unnamed protein product [Callosobruchus maculatus]|uniref:Uncharacterized protein n=1 Tax=Callosobruchus maculatus TaxID=64391 RepID=A0A653DB17_CALMS|nr:unnamed protein product [Callosobruchus maculatus]
MSLKLKKSNSPNYFMEKMHEDLLGIYPLIIILYKVAEHVM